MLKKKVPFCNEDLMECMSYLSQIYDKEMKLNNSTEKYVLDHFSI